MTAYREVNLFAIIRDLDHLILCVYIVNRLIIHNFFGEGYPRYFWDNHQKTEILAKNFVATKFFLPKIIIKCIFISNDVKNKKKKTFYSFAPNIFFFRKQAPQQ